MIDFKPALVTNNSPKNGQRGLKYALLTCILSLFIASQALPPLVLLIVSFTFVISLIYLIVAGTQYLLSQFKTTTKEEAVNNVVVSRSILKSKFWLFGILYLLLLVLSLFILAGLIDKAFQNSSDLLLVLYTTFATTLFFSIPLVIFFFFVWRIAVVKSDLLKKTINVVAIIIAFGLGGIAWIPCGDGSNNLLFFLTLSFDEQSMCGHFSVLPLGFAAIMWSYLGYLLVLPFAVVRYAVHRFIDPTVASHGNYLLVKKLLFFLRVVGVIITLAVALINLSYYSIEKSGYDFAEDSIWTRSGFIL